MPHFANERDRTVRQAIERWKLDAREELIEIEIWRERPADRGTSHDPWPRWPTMFGATTSYLVGWVTTQHPKLDPTPLMDFYNAVNAWHTDRVADRVPPQPVLEEVADRAVMILQAAEMAIEGRVIQESEQHPIETDSQQERPASGMAAPAELASEWGTEPEATRKHLARWRAKHADGWIQNPERRPNEPEFLYDRAQVKPAMQDLLSRQTRRHKRRTNSSGQRPAEKF